MNPKAVRELGRLIGELSRVTTGGDDARFMRVQVSTSNGNGALFDGDGFLAVALLAAAVEAMRCELHPAEVKR